MQRSLYVIGIVLFTVAAHAQKVKWELAIPLSTPNATNSAVFSDGVGGGALLLGANGTGGVVQVVWFSSKGALKESIDIPTVSLGYTTNTAALKAHYDTYRMNTSDYSDQNLVFNALADAFFDPIPSVRGSIDVLRVTPKVLDMRETMPDGRSVLLRFVPGQIVKDVPLEDSENVASVATSEPDKRGFFTTKLSQTNLIVRRYSF
jgi:hypothetical protein